MPVRIYSENGCVAKHGAELAALGTRALIITGKQSSRRNGSLQDVTEILEKYRIPCTVFDQTEENPSVETVMSARELGLASGADFVIGIGGGSAMDAAKAAAVMLCNPDKNRLFLYEQTSSPALPVAAVPTTCGTGSEVTGVAVLTRHELRTKCSMTHRVFPRLALIDGRYLLTAPRAVLCNTFVDALAHLVESIINTKSNRFSELSAYAGLEWWGKCRSFLMEPEALSPKKAQLLMDTAAFAGMSIAQTGTAIPHALSYILTARGGIPHGAAVGVFLSNYMEMADSSVRERILRACRIPDTDALRGLLETLAPVRTEQSILEQSADAVLQNPAKLAVCPFRIDRTVMNRLIRI